MSPVYSCDKQCCGYFCAFHLLYIRLTLELYLFSILLGIAKLLCKSFLQCTFCLCENTWLYPQHLVLSYFLFFAKLLTINSYITMDLICKSLITSECGHFFICLFIYLWDLSLWICSCVLKNMVPPEEVWTWPLAF